MDLFGYSDLQARSAYQPTFTNRASGVSPNRPPRRLPAQSADRARRRTTDVDRRRDRSKTMRDLAHIPGEPSKPGGGESAAPRWPASVTAARRRTRTKARATCCGASAVGARNLGRHRPGEAHPPDRRGQRAARYHKSWWECDTGIAFLVSGRPYWRTRRMTQIYDLSDPAKPVFIRNFGCQASSRARPARYRPNCTARFHGPKGNRVYFGYGTGATASCRSSIARSS